MTFLFQISKKDYTAKLQNIITKRELTMSRKVFRVCVNCDLRLNPIKNYNSIASTQERSNVPKMKQGAG